MDFFPKAFFNSGFPKLFCFIPSLLSWFVRLENEELEGFELSVLERFAIIFLRHLVPLLRKEVIQPHLPVRLPCYDFTPLTLHTFGASPLSVGPATSGADDSGGVTGGVYKARERIHRGMLIRDY